MTEEEYTNYLLYQLIHLPKKKEQEEYDKLNGLPADCLDVPKKVETDPELLNNLRQALTNMALAIPVLEERNDSIIPRLDDSSYYLTESIPGSRTASMNTRALRKLQSASRPTKKLRSLIEANIGKDEFILTETGQVWCISIPLSQILSIFMNDGTVDIQ